MKYLKNNQLKSALGKSELTIGSWLTIPSAVVAEIMARAGFPWLVVDLEHSVIGLETMQSMFLAIENHGSLPLVRISDKDPIQTKRVLDAGAYGIIVPMVNSREDAESAVRSVKYPPEGNRGFGLARAQGYGAAFKEYKSLINANSLVICQIENKQGVENIDDILSVKGIDGIMIGPYDLSGSLGVPGQLSHPLVLEAEKKILAAARRHTIPAGIHIVHPDQKQLEEKIQEDFRFIVYGVDQIFLSDSCNKAGSLICDIDKSSS